MKLGPKNSDYLLHDPKSQLAIEKKMLYLHIEKTSQ